MYEEEDELTVDKFISRWRWEKAVDAELNEEKKDNTWKEEDDEDQEGSSPPHPPSHEQNELGRSRRRTTRSEPCMFHQYGDGDQIIYLPVSLFNSSNLKVIFSMESWELLGPAEQRSLLRFLPPSVSEEGVASLLRTLFDFKANFHFGNPLKKFVNQLKGGLFHEDVVRAKRELVQSQEGLRRVHWNNYFAGTCKEVFSHLDDLQFSKGAVLESVRVEGGLLTLWNRRVEFIERRISEMVSRKRRRREEKRVLNKKRKISINLLEKESTKSDSEGSETDVDSSIADSIEDSDYEELTRKAKRHKQYKMQKKRKEAAAVKIAKEAKTATDQPKKAQSTEYPVFCLFTTVRDTFLENNLVVDFPTLVQSISQSAPLLTTIPPQYSKSSFTELVLKFLAHPPHLPQQAAGTSDIQMAPFVELLEGDTWKWKAPPVLPERLQSLEQLFYFTITRKKQSMGNEKLSIPFNLIKQQKCKVTIPETSPYAVSLFHSQEKERFENCGKPYVFDIQGVKSVVAPIKRSASSSIKAREHILLVENRPGHINLLSLIHNAAARLPGGIGTRADVALLMKDSQYVKPGSSDKRLNQVVSGALDRLQSIVDPPVDYDPDQKLWIYLHRLRNEEDFGNEGEEDSMNDPEDVT